MTSVPTMEQTTARLMYSGGLSGGLGWLAAVVVAALFVVVVHRPESIRNPMMFRWASTIVGLAVLVPPAVTFLISVYFTANETMGRASAAANNFLILGQMAGPVLLGLSILAAFAALRPREERRALAADEPRKHPLD